MYLRAVGIQGHSFAFRRPNITSSLFESLCSLTAKGNNSKPQAPKLQEALCCYQCSCGGEGCSYRVISHSELCLLHFLYHRCCLAQNVAPMNRTCYKKSPRCTFWFTFLLRKGIPGGSFPYMN